MSTKRKSTFKQLFNAWLKAQKKDAEAFKLKCYINNLARKLDDYTTELIEYEEKIYRVTIDSYSHSNGYKIEVIANTVELPVKN